MEIYPSFWHAKTIENLEPFQVWNNLLKSTTNNIKQFFTLSVQGEETKRYLEQTKIIIEPRDEEYGERSRNLSLTMFSKTTIKQPSVPKEQRKKSG